MSKSDLGCKRELHQGLLRRYLVALRIEEHGNGKVSAERVLELLKANLKTSASEDTAHCGYSEIEQTAIREFAECVLADIEAYENGYED
ncbi:hypothetical protein KHA80_03125 [Anaerobacillus sp. HL2]|nr:hypothetical protein KHA80_03125 [Anaerobacillus sp. HL2]